MALFRSPWARRYVRHVAGYVVELSGGRDLVVEADTYRHEGRLTVFYVLDDPTASRVINSWSTPLASVRTADVRCIHHRSLAAAVEEQRATERHDRRTPPRHTRPNAENPHYVKLTQMRTGAQSPS